MTRKLLALLARPRTLAELSRALEVEEATTRLLLERLEAAGYIGRAYPESETCTTACEVCSLQRLCPAAGKPAAALPAVFRLTEKGKKALSSKA